MKTVYIVDDSPLIRERLIEMLSGTEDALVIGETGDPMDAFGKIRALRPDIVILDVQLPGRSGIEILKDIQQARIGTHVIILTNFAYPQYQRECLEAGADAFLSKMKDFDRLPSILRSLESIAERNDEGSNDWQQPCLSSEEKPP